MKKDDKEPKYKLNIRAMDWLNVKYVGVYQLGPNPMSFCIALTKKPNIIHRFFMWLLLGFVWRDNVPTLP